VTRETNGVQRLARTKMAQQRDAVINVLSSDDEAAELSEVPMMSAAAPALWTSRTRSGRATTTQQTLEGCLQVCWWPRVVAKRAVAFLRALAAVQNMCLRPCVLASLWGRRRTPAATSLAWAAWLQIQGSVSWRPRVLVMMQLGGAW
jgi:hypothetical protein